MASKFRSNVWDPLLIIFQIISMQCQYYLTLIILIYVTIKFQHLFKVNSNNLLQYSLENMFDFSLINFINWKGKILSLIFISNSLLSAIFECYIVARSKQCLDFTVTLHIYHILLCSVYTGFIPNTFFYWFIMIISSIIMTVLSEYLCMIIEMREIPLALVNPKADL